MIAWLLLGLALADPLVDAVSARDRKAVDALLAAGHDPNVTVVRSSSSRGGLFGLGKLRTTEIETSPLQEAVADALRDGDVRILEALLARGADPSRRTATYPPPLHRVAGEVNGPGAAKVTEALLKAGVDPTGVFRQQAVTGSLPSTVDATWFVDRLLKAGADAGALLCDAPTEPLVARLIAAGGDVNGACFGRPPVVRAAAAHATGAVTRLLDAGADPNAVGVIGGTPMAPLHAAAATGWPEGIALLVSRGADPNRPAGVLGAPPLALAASREAAVALVEAGAVRSAGFRERGAAVWFARPVDPAERGAVLASWALDDVVLLPEELQALPPDRVRARVEALGAGRFEQLARGLSPDQLAVALSFAWGADCGLDVTAPPTAGELRAALGGPDAREVGPATVRFTWADASAEVWRPGYGEGAVLVEGRCPAGGQALVGLPRDAVWLALGEPALPGPARDRWADGVVVRYEADVAVAWGVAWPLRSPSAATGR